MAPSRELANLFADDEKADLEAGEIGDLKPQIQSQALIPHPTIRSEAAVAAAPVAAAMDLASLLTGDMNSMKSLLTCGICDQLLYEPWTISYGHTYCYGCLSSWFQTNAARKTCPSCRSVVREMPAPAFTVRDIVNIFVARAEIMPAEESVTTHQQRREEERVIVEKDRESAHGLFKGTFTGRHIQRIIFDEADRIHRCGACGHEFRPGPACLYCGTDFEGEEEQLADDHWSDDADDDEDDIDGIDLEDIEYGLDGEDMSQMGYDSDGEEHDWEDGIPHMMGGPIPMHHAHLVAAELRHHLGRIGLHRGHHHFYHGDVEADHDGEGSSDEEDSDGESAGSLNEFIDHDDDNQDMAESAPPRRVNRRNRHSIVAISSDDDQEQDGEEEDEDDRPIRSRFRSHNSRSRPMVIDEDDEEEDDDHDDDHFRDLPSRSRRIRPQLETDDSGSEANDNSGVALNRIRGGGRPSISDSDSEAEPAVEPERNVDMEAFGWSPLANGPESGDEESHELNGYNGYESEQSGGGSDHTLRVEEDNDGSVQSVQWDDEENPYDQEELALASRQSYAHGMPHVPNPPRRRRPWEQESPPARRNRRQQEGVQRGSAQRAISLDSESEENSSSENEAEDDEEIQSGQDVEMSEASVSPSRTAETAEREDEEGLGQAYVAHVDADQSSEDSMQPPRRRRRLRSLRQEQHEEDDYDHFGFGSQVFNSPPRHSRVPRTSRISRPGQYYEPRRAEPFSPAFRSPRRAQYAFNLPAMESPGTSRRPRGYEYNADSYSRSRPHDNYY